MRLIYHTLLASLLLQCNPKSEVTENGNNKIDIPLTTTNDVAFDVPVQDLPYSFAGYIINQLNDEVKYDEMIQKLKNEIDKKEGQVLAEKLGYQPSLQFVMNQTNIFAPEYYNLILKGDCDCRLINSFVYKRFPSIAGKEVLVFGQIIYDDMYKTRRGFTLELVVYDKNYSKIEDRARLLVVGIGKEDTRYQEAFQINKDYAIQIKSYNSIEGESTTIIRNVIVDSLGNIKELKPKIERKYSMEE